MKTPLSKCKKHQIFRVGRGEISFPEPYIVPRLQYESTKVQPESPIELPFICSATDLLQLEHLGNPMTIFGQPFSGKTSLFMKLATQSMNFYGPSHWIRMVDLRMAALQCISTGKRPKDIHEFIANQLQMCPNLIKGLFKPLVNVRELIEQKKYKNLLRGDLFLDGVDEMPDAEREYFLKLLPQLKRKRFDCPVRVWINSRSFFKARLLNILGDECAFEILDFDSNMQKKLLFSRWKQALFPKSIKKFEENRLVEYTDVMYHEFCKEIKDFDSTFGTCPLYLEIIASIFHNHAVSFFALYHRVREDQLAGPDGDGLPQCKCERKAPETSSKVESEKDKKKRKKTMKNIVDKTPKPSDTTTTATDGDLIDAVNLPTTQLLCQLAGTFTMDVLEYLALTVVDLYCLKFLYIREMTDEEYNIMLESEYRRMTRLYSEYAIRTYPTYQYDTIIPSSSDPNVMLPNLKLILDEELHRFGLMVMDKQDGTVKFRNKILGNFLLAKHFACPENINVRDVRFDCFLLRVVLFDNDAKYIRSYLDSMLHFHTTDYRPQIVHDFLVKQYKLGSENEAEWEKIKNDGTVVHMAIMEGFHRTALTMIHCFDPVLEREQVRKLLKIKAPVEIYEGSRADVPLFRVEESVLSRRHMLSPLSLIALFVYGGAMEELLRAYLTFFTLDEVREEFRSTSVYKSWTPMHYAAMHSNLWFIMYMYNETLIPDQKIQPPAEMYNYFGQLPLHILMSFMWNHIMIVKDYLYKEYDTLGGCESADCKHKKALAEDRDFKKDSTENAVACFEEAENVQMDEHEHFREILCLRQMVKEVHGVGNLLRIAHLECIRLMTEYGGDSIDAPEKSTGNTILHYACQDGCLDSVQYILQRGAQIESKNHHGQSPMHFAGMHGQRKIFMLLAEKGAKHDIEDHDGNTPMALWVKQGKKDIKPKNEPMSERETKFFQACDDLAKLLEQKKVEEEERTKLLAKTAELESELTANPITEDDDKPFDEDEISTVELKREKNPSFKLTLKKVDYFCRDKNSKKRTLADYKKGSEGYDSEKINHDNEDFGDDLGICSGQEQKEQEGNGRGQTNDKKYEENGENPNLDRDNGESNRRVEENEARNEPSEEF